MKATSGSNPKISSSKTLCLKPTLAILYTKRIAKEELPKPRICKRLQIKRLIRWQNAPRINTSANTVWVNARTSRLRSLNLVIMKPRQIKISVRAYCPGRVTSLKALLKRKDLVNCLIECQSKLIPKLVAWLKVTMIWKSITWLYAQRIDAIKKHLFNAQAHCLVTFITARMSLLTLSIAKEQGACEEGIACY